MVSIVSSIGGRVTLDCASRAACSVAGVCGIGDWPRHCFSSHSTQNVRPWLTGKPHARHFCRFLNPGGTETELIVSGAPMTLCVPAAADQNSAFFGEGSKVARLGAVAD